MSGLSFRLKLWLKLWFTSVHALVVMLLIPLTLYVFHLSQSFTFEFITEMIYEKVAPLVFVFILQWGFAIDFDSKFVGQLITYRVSRWQLIIEKYGLSTLIFIGLLGVVTLLLALCASPLAWKILLTSLPMYVGLGGIVVLGTVIGNHSLGGLFVGFLFWIILNYQPRFMDSPWINIGLGILGLGMAILHFNRKTV